MPATDLTDLEHAVGALYDEMERSGVLMGDNKTLIYLTYRTRRELARALCQGTSAAHWQHKIDGMGSRQEGPPNSSCGVSHNV